MKRQKQRSSKQKFIRYDLVQIADDLGSSMSHFTKSKRAIVIGSYSDEYPWGGKSGRKQYALCIEGQGFSAWYLEHQLTLIEPGRIDLYEKWEDGDDC